jgi:hypothetical protein
MSGFSRRLAVGDALLLADKDYLFGSGPLLLCVVSVDAIRPDWWAEVAGQVLGPDGQPARARSWTAIRLAAVPGARAAAAARLGSAA